MVFMTKQPKNRADLEAMLNVKAWKDPKFKKKLLSDPHGALKEMGIDIKNVKVKVIEEEKDTVIFVLHPTPMNPEISDEELRRVAGGGYDGGTNNCVQDCPGHLTQMNITKR
jgi:predicted phosphohydrolase